MHPELEKIKEEARGLVKGLIGQITKPVPYELSYLALANLMRVSGKGKEEKAPLSPSLDSNLRDSLDSNLRVNLWVGLGNSLWNRLGDNLRDSLGGSLRVSLGNSLRVSLGGGLADSLGNSLRVSLGGSLRDRLGDSLDSNLGNNLRDSLGNNLRVSLEGSLDSNLRVSLGGSLEGKKVEHYCGQFWLYWVILYLLGARLGAKYEADKLEALLLFALYCPIVVRVEGTFIFPRPTRASFMEIEEGGLLPRYELHSEDGSPAVSFLGKDHYFHEGVSLPSEIGSVPVFEWKPEWILTTQNQEVRRLLLQKIPPESVAKVLDLRVIDTYQSRFSRYELVEAKNNPYPSRYVAIRTTCPSTGKPYLLRVAPNISSCERAVVALNGGIHPDTFVVEH